MRPGVFVLTLAALTASLLAVTACGGGDAAPVSDASAGVSGDALVAQPDASDAGPDATAPDAFYDGRADSPDAPAPPALAPSGPVVLDNQTDASVVGLHVTSDAGACVRIVGGAHVSVRGSEIGPCAGNGIEVSGGAHDVTIADNYVHPEHPAAGCCDTGDGLFVSGADTLLVQGNVIAYGEANIEMNTVTGVHVVGNFLLNPQNAGSRGQNVQVWGQSSDLHVENNYTLSSLDPMYAYAEKQEDSINFGLSDQIVAKGNYVTGGHSPSGCGIIADEAATNVQFLSNVLVDTGQCGINISDGTNQLVDGNKILNSTPVVGGGNSGLVVWKEYPEACGPVTVSNNISSALKPDLTTESGYWNGGGCDPVTLTSNVWDALARAMLTPAAQKLPPPPIPPLPFACVAPAPWVNNASFSRCAK
jgi:hypothetical protein